MTSPTQELRAAALCILCLRDPLAKARSTQALGQTAETGLLDTERVFAPATDVPGRRRRPALVPPQNVPMRSPSTPGGRAALLHAIAHIEFNAIKFG